jgi:hypothetical protein
MSERRRRLEQQFRGEQSEAEGEAQEERVHEADKEAQQQTNTNRRSTEMPVIDGSDWGLDDIPELKTLAEGSEVKLRIIEASVKPDRNSDDMLTVELEVIDEPLVKSIYLRCHLPSQKFTPKKTLAVKRTLKEFGDCFEFNFQRRWSPEDLNLLEGYVVLGLQPARDGYPAQNVISQYLVRK